MARQAITLIVSTGSWNNTQVLSLARGKARSRFPRIGQALLEQARALLEGIGHGRTYTYSGMVHTASAPGEPPAEWTGQLKGSLVIEIGADYVGLKCTDPKGVMLELGTAKMAPRPFLRPTLSLVAPKVDAIMREV